MKRRLDWRCAVPGCDRRAKGQFCGSHQFRLRTKGDVLADVPLGDLPRVWVKDRESCFWKKVRKPEDPSACWEWTGGKDAKGYGAFWNGTRITKAYRWSYERWIGPIPTGLQIDHLCRNPGCVNPQHLEPVTMRTNLERGAKPYARFVHRTHCKHGHPWTPDNVKINSKGHKECRSCINNRSLARTRAA